MGKKGKDASKGAAKGGAAAPAGPPAAVIGPCQPRFKQQRRQIAPLVGAHAGNDPAMIFSARYVAQDQPAGACFARHQGARLSRQLHLVAASAPQLRRIDAAQAHRDEDFLAQPDPRPYPQCVAIDNLDKFGGNRAGQHLAACPRRPAHIIGRRWYCGTGQGGRPKARGAKRHPALGPGRSARRRRFKRGGKRDKHAASNRLPPHTPDPARAPGPAAIFAPIRQDPILPTRPTTYTRT